MGFSFQTEEERNPTNVTPPTPPADPCAEVQAKLDELNQFIDENNLLKNFYLWQELRDEFARKKMIEETQNGFEEIN